MKNAHRFLSVLLATLPLFAQETAGPSPPKARVAAAEQLFRDAWWAESGANDADAALRGYLAAAAAEGPVAVRARALLFAGRLQQKQGKADAALATFRRVLGEFATETATVNEARGHLRELTAVDLRQNYDEWFERRLFSEEVQLTVLGKIEALASLDRTEPGGEPERTEHRQQIRRLLAELRAFGKGAVPGLRKAAVGGHRELANTAIDLLFELGEVPPIAALLLQEDWSLVSEQVRRLVQAQIGPQGFEVPRDRPHARAVAAALAGPQGVVEFVLQDGGRLHGERIVPLVAAVLVDTGARGRLLAALHEPQTPLVVRDAIETAWTQTLDREVPAAEWVALGKDPLRAETRIVAATRGVTVLGPDDAQELDQLLAWLVDRESAPNTHDRPLVAAFAEGLRYNLQPEMLPWSAARLRALLVALATNPDAHADEAMTQITRRAESRKVLVQALFVEPLVLANAFRTAGDDVAAAESLTRNFVGASSTDADILMHGRKWNAALAETMSKAWPSYDDPSRIAALVVLRGAIVHVADKRAIATLLAGLRGAASASVQAAIDPLLAHVGG